MKRLEGKTALITGTARGIGLAFARAYVAEGARVAIADTDIERARTSADELGTADDLVGMATFLASHEADYIISQTDNVDGGQWMS